MKGRIGHFRQMLAGLAVVLTSLVGIGAWLAPQVRIEITSERLVPDGGLAYRHPAPVPFAPFYVISSDGPGRTTNSKARLEHRGRPVGTPHAVHADIRARGGGLYSVWQGQLFFSTSDGSAPTDGFMLTGPSEVRPSLITMTWMVVFSALACNLAHLSAILRRHPVTAPVTLSLVMAGLLLAAAAGWIPPLGGTATEPKDWPLISALAKHLALGLALYAGWVMLGGGLWVAISRNRSAPAWQLVLFGYPLAMVVAMPLTLLTLMVPWGAAIACLLWVSGCLPMLRWRPLPDDKSARRLLETLGGLIPFALLFASIWSLWWHGPTSTLTSSTLGDLVHYAATAETLATPGMLSLPYFPNLGVEGASALYLNHLLQSITASFAWLPFHDPFLFITATAQIFFLLSTCLGLTALRERVGAVDARWSTLTVVLVLGACMYPSWVIESATVVLAFPLVISAWTIHRETSKAAATLGGTALCIFGSLMSKILSMPVFAPALIVTALRQATGPGQGPVVRAVLVAFLVVFGTSLIAIAGYALPRTLTVMNQLGPVTVREITVWGNHGWDRILPHLLGDIGVVLVATSTLWFRTPLLRLSLMVCAASYLVYSWSFYTTAYLGILWMALACMEPVGRPSKAPRLLWLAGGMMLVHGFWTDVAGWQATLPWLAALAPAVLLATRPDALPRGMIYGVWIVLACAGLAVGTGGLRPDSGWRQGPPPLTPDIYDIWHAVRDQATPGALVFTDQTANNRELTGGWNTYAMLGRHQIYLSAPMADRIWGNTQELAERLDRNRKVLDGRLSPDRAGLSRSYPAYYAVVSSSAPFQTKGETIYTNASFRLIRLAP